MIYVIVALVAQLVLCVPLVITYKLVKQVKKKK